MTRLGTVVLDLDGVVYRGNTGIEGAGDAMQEIVNAGLTLLFATNNASRSQQSVVDKIAECTGFRANPADVVTSAMAAARFMQSRYASALVVGVEGLKWEMQQAGIEIVETPDAESVVVGVDFDITYDDIAIASEAIRNGAAFIATNTDATFPKADGRLAPGAGAVVAAIATASGSEPIVCGKPHDPMGRLVSDLAVGDLIWMVGDRLETDIELAKNQGWRSILALTGVTASGAEIPAELTPDHIVASIADVPDLILSHDSAANVSLE